MESLFKDCIHEICNIIIAASIFEISQDDRMINVATNSIKEMDNKNDPYYIYNPSNAFYYLLKLNRPETNKILENYSDHNEYLISYNAKQALGMLRLQS